MSTLIDAVAKAQVSDRLREAEHRRAHAVRKPERQSLVRRLRQRYLTDEREGLLRTLHRARA